MSHVQPRSEYALLAVTAPDRVGLVAEATTFLWSAGASIVANYAAQASEGYEIRFLISAPASKMRQLIATIDDGLPGFDISIEQLKCVRPLAVSILTIDQVGVISEAAETLAHLNVNVVFEASCSFFAPNSGTPFFAADMILDLPGDVSIGEVKQWLDETAARRGWELSIRDAIVRPQPSVFATLFDSFSTKERADWIVDFPGIRQQNYEFN